MVWVTETRLFLFISVFSCIFLFFLNKRRFHDFYTVQPFYGDDFRKLCLDFQTSIAEADIFLSEYNRNWTVNNWRWMKEFVWGTSFLTLFAPGGWHICSPPCNRIYQKKILLFLFIPKCMLGTIETTFHGENLRFCISGLLALKNVLWSFKVCNWKF